VSGVQSVAAIRPIGALRPPRLTVWRESHRNGKWGRAWRPSCCRPDRHFSLHERDAGRAGDPHPGPGVPRAIDPPAQTFPRVTRRVMRRVTQGR
jgi:hypothetical protein